MRLALATALNLLHAVSAQVSALEIEVLRPRRRERSDEIEEILDAFCEEALRRKNLAQECADELKKLLDDSEPI